MLPYRFLIIALSYTDSKQLFQSSLHTVPLISVLPLSPTNVFSNKKYFKCTLCSCLKNNCYLLASKFAITCMQRDQYHLVPMHRIGRCFKVSGINRFSVNPASPICNLMSNHTISVNLSHRFTFSFRHKRLVLLLTCHCFQDKGAHNTSNGHTPLISPQLLCGPWRFLLLEGQTFVSRRVCDARCVYHVTSQD